MDVRHAHVQTRLPVDVAELLDAYRDSRGFDPAVEADAKAVVLNRYCAEHRIDAVVLPLSGGVDSGVVAGLVRHAMDRPGSPIATAVAVTLPVSGDVVARQRESRSLAELTADRFALPLVDIDLHDAWASIRRGANEAASALGLDGSRWAEGQLVSAVRTPALAYVASLLSAAGHRAVIVGTTNSDEGSYLGYVGKYSDGMVDIQPISDLHKSEVYALGRHLDVPAAVLEATPSGDMFDGAFDTTVFGAPYEAVELHFAHRRGMLDARLLAHLSDESQELLDEWFDNLEHLHRYNAHKYLVGSPAVHLDLRDASLPGGSPDRSLTAAPLGRQELGSTARLRGWAGELTISAEGSPTDVEVLDVAGAFVRVIRGALDAQSIAELQAQIGAAEMWQPVGLDGFDRRDGEPVGSLRATFWVSSLARHLTGVLVGLLPEFVVDDDGGELPVDVWRPQAVTSLGRVVRYVEGGELWAHCDSPFVLDDEHRTVFSVVVCVRADRGTARTAYADRSGHGVDDWGRAFTDDEVVAEAELAPGDVVVFPHRTAHSSPLIPAGAGEKWVMRLDVIAGRVQVPGVGSVS